MMATNTRRSGARSVSCASPFTYYVVRAACFLAAFLLLAACGGGNLTQTAQTEHYTVQLTLDGLGFGERLATVELNDTSGNPADANVVVVAPVMRQMGMASPEATAQQVAPGRYEARGEFFSMLGAWEIDVRIDNGNSEEVATFKYDVTQ